MMKSTKESIELQLFEFKNFLQLVISKSGDGKQRTKKKKEQDMTVWKSGGGNGVIG